MTTIYRDHIIEEVFTYRHGVSDYEVFHKNSERGYMEPSKTLEHVKMGIDEIYQELEDATKEQL